MELLSVRHINIIKMKKFALLFISVIILFDLSAQINKYGTPIIKNYSRQVTQGSEQNWWITKDKSGAVYFGNDDKGVIRFDGTSWTNIPVRNNSRVRTLGTDEDGIIYVGCAYEFGYIEPGIKGELNYISLSQRYDSKKGSTVKPAENIEIAPVNTAKDTYIGEINGLVVKDSSVYFLSNQSLFIYNRLSDSLKYINLRDLLFRSFIRIYSIEDRIILAENAKGLYEFKNGKIELLPGGDFFKKKMCLTILPVSRGKVLVGTYGSGIFLYDFITGVVNENWVDKSVNDRISKIYCGAKLFTGEFFLGTAGSGIYILDSDGKLAGYWNNEKTELQDNFIYALYVDPNKDNELWISTLGYLSKAYTNTPITKFGDQSGINGGVNGICELNSVIYLSTDDGAVRSKVDKDGCRYFEKVEGIEDQVFPIYRADIGQESFLLAGSIKGLYQITKNGKVINVRESMKFKKGRDETAYSIRYIYQSRKNPSLFYIGLSTDGLVVIEYQNGKWIHNRNIKKLQGNISSEQECENGDILVTTDFPNGAFKIQFNDTIPVKYGPEKGLPEDTKLNSLGYVKGNILLTTERGIFKYNLNSDSWTHFDEVTAGYSSGKNVNNIFEDPDKDAWVEIMENSYHTILFPQKGDKASPIKGPLLLLPNVNLLNISSFSDRIWIAKSNNVFVVDKRKLVENTSEIHTLLTKILIGGDSVVMNGTFYSKSGNGKRIPSLKYSGTRIPEIKYNLNSISFYWTTPYYIEEESIVYSYKLEGFSNDWSKWEAIFYKDFTNLPYGKYTFRVKAKTLTEIESKEAAYEFYILKPWYLTAVMLILYIIVFIFIIFAIIKAYTRKLKNENIRLEGIVAERTAVVVKQKEELESSIHYASRIQMALLPSEAILQENLKNYFILFKPRDIVSGDFYWMTKKNNRLYVVAADCTGHGVPGAFMSLLGMSFLDEIIDKENAPRADHILSELRLHVTDSLKQVGGDNEAKDGMDMALLVVDFNTSRIEFSGAYNPCFRVRKLTEEEAGNYKDENAETQEGSITDGKYLLETIYASKMPIGISSRMNESFVFFDWTLERGISYYLFSDGYIDQFGGPDGRKFMKKNFKRFILEIQDYPMNKQKELLEQNLKSWMGQTPQIDDILVMGIRTE
jgi:serine phosphatase RsbU (regulator of sigma subunit)